MKPHVCREAASTQTQSTQPRACGGQRASLQGHLAGPWSGPLTSALWPRAAQAQACGVAAGRPGSWSRVPPGEGQEATAGRGLCEAPAQSRGRKPRLLLGESRLPEPACRNPGQQQPWGVAAARRPLAGVGRLVSRRGRVLGPSRPPPAQRNQKTDFLASFLFFWPWLPVLHTELGCWIIFF